MNRLAHESSLYLRQHAHNPVDWHPWGDEAIALAKKLDKPIFLSVGYSACHWCHVMERESFEDADTARLLNEHFVCVKVDREERPDVDAIYMAAVQALNDGSGGWPMSVWLTPDLEPFYAGTYYPPRDQYGRPSFRRVLTALAEAWRDRRDQIGKTADTIADHLRRHGELTPAEGELSDELLKRAAMVMKRAHDPRHGGFGNAPKFPHALELRLALRLWLRFGDEELLSVAKLTLDKMARGGIYDHLGGGFHRYSVDAQWLVPHFEKMLYDNALLTLAYVEAFQATGDAFYRRVVEETCDYVGREMTSPPGAFYSTQDADSEGVEGKFFVWSRSEVMAVLGADLGEPFCNVYDVSDAGNWEGHNILNRLRTDEQDAKLLGLSVEELRAKLADALAKLLAVRSQRVWPGRDEKILASWNGLMIGALARAGAVLGRTDYTAAAAKAADFVLTQMRGDDGRLYHTTGVGQPPKIDAHLEDYAYLIDALVSLYEATFAPRWLTAAGELAGLMLDRFADPAGGFFTTAAGQSDLIVRLKDRHDGSTPSGNAMAVTGLLRLAAHTDEARWREAAERTLTAFHGEMADNPLASGQMLTALDFFLGPLQQVAVIGSADDEETDRVLEAARSTFAPHRVLAFHDPASGEATLPLVAGKPAGHMVRTFVCENYACDTPLDGAVQAVAAKRGGSLVAPFPPCYLGLMPLSLEQYATWLDGRDLPWPVAPPPQPVKAKPHLPPLPEVRAVLWTVYGTLLSIPFGELVFEHPTEFVMTAALEKTIHEFKMWASMSRKPGAPSEYFGHLYKMELDKLRMAPSPGEKYPEIPSERLWEELIKKLLQKEYKFDASFYGSLNEYARKVAYFFHASLQGTACYPNVGQALRSVIESGRTQGLLGDGQAFTPMQLARGLDEQGLRLDDAVPAGLRVLSYEVRGKKPSERLFKAALDKLAAKGIAPPEVLHVGSRLAQDLAPAKKLGMRTALYAGDKASLDAPPDRLKDPTTKPDVLLTDLAQIADVLGS